VAKPRVAETPVNFARAGDRLSAGQSCWTTHEVDRPAILARNVSRGPPRVGRTPALLDLGLAGTGSGGASLEIISSQASHLWEGTWRALAAIRLPRPFAWAPFPARAAKTEPLEPAGGPAPGPRTELTLIRRLYPRRAENRREPTESIKCLTML
jgi:hypothetical protein